MAPEARTLVCAAAAALGAILLYHRRRRTRPAARFPVEPPSTGLAAIYELTDVDRTDLPWGGRKGNGPPGQPAAHYLEVGALKTTIEISSVTMAGGFMLYSIEPTASGGWEEPMLVFLELDAPTLERMYLDEAFIDRGVRKLVRLGARVAVVSMATAEAYIRVTGRAASAGGGTTAGALDAAWSSRSGGAGGRGLGIVWNTGRCGSTLLGKALMAVDAACLSEPHWSDQLVCKPPHVIGEAATRRAFKACMSLEGEIACRAVPRWRNATCIVLNPKCGGAHVAAAVTAAFPRARHIFMYRACEKVVESFGGLLHSGHAGIFEGLVWRLQGTSAGPPFLTHFATARGVTALRGLSSLRVAAQTAMWLDNVDGWDALCEQRAAAGFGADDPVRCAPPLRYDEFVTKDLFKREQVLVASLEALGALAHLDGGGATVEAKASAIGKALAVFNVHSQAGSKMAGAKAPFLTSDDLPTVRRCVSQAFAGRRGLKVENGGANVVLAGSLGCA